MPTKTKPIQTQFILSLPALSIAEVSNGSNPTCPERSRRVFPDMAGLSDIEIFVSRTKLKILILPDMLDILLKNYKFRRLLVC